MLSIIQNPAPTRGLGSPIQIRDRHDESTIGKALTPLISLWSKTLVSLKLDCVIDIPQFLFMASNSMLPNLETLDVCTIIDENERNATYWAAGVDLIDEHESSETYWSAALNPGKQYRACGDLLRGLVAALPAMRSLTKLDVRFRDPEYDDTFAGCLFIDLSTKINTKRLVWQPLQFPHYGSEVYRTVVPCCPLVTEGGTMVATGLVLPGRLVTEFQNAVWEYRRQKVAAFCCRDCCRDTSHSVRCIQWKFLPCTQWNKETGRWDFVFLNDMDVFIWQMGVFWGLTIWDY